MTRQLVLAFVLATSGIVLVGFGLYWVPADAYPIQEAFRELGEEQTATVVETSTFERSYTGGGRRGGTKTYEERSVRVRLQSGREVTIQDLVLGSDFDDLSPDDEVSITLIRGNEARERLPEGPYYLLTSSVEAGTFSLYGWAFGGRPANGMAILGVIGGIVLGIAGGVLLLIFWPRKRRPTATERPAKRNQGPDTPELGLASPVDRV